MNRTEAKAKAKELLKKAEDEAQAQLVSVETKFPIGTALVFLAIGIVLGLYLRGLVH